MNDGKFSRFERLGWQHSREEEFRREKAPLFAAIDDDDLCGEPIDAAIVAPCERPKGHAGPCRAYSLER